MRSVSVKPGAALGFNSDQAGFYTGLDGRPGPGQTLRSRVEDVPTDGIPTNLVLQDERPNLLRVVLGSDAQAAARAEVVLLESNIDDLNPELVPDAIERCFVAGALDVWTVPAQMKKGRLGIVLSALSRPGDEAAVAHAMLEETSTLGVRLSHLRRYEVEREERTVEVEGGSVRVKIGWLDGRVVNIAPEHDDCAALARATGRSVKSVWVAALTAAHER